MKGRYEKEVARPNCSYTLLSSISQNPSVKTASSFTIVSSIQSIHTCMMLPSICYWSSFIVTFTYSKWHLNLLYTGYLSYRCMFGVFEFNPEHVACWIRVQLNQETLVRGWWVQGRRWNVPTNSLLLYRCRWGSTKRAIARTWGRLGECLSRSSGCGHLYTPGL